MLIFVVTSTYSEKILVFDFLTWLHIGLISEKIWNFIGLPQRLKSDLFEIFLRTYAAPEVEGACEVKKNIKKQPLF